MRRQSPEDMALFVYVSLTPVTLLYHLLATVDPSFLLFLSRQFVIAPPVSEHQSLGAASRSSPTLGPLVPFVRWDEQKGGRGGQAT